MAIRSWTDAEVTSEANLTEMRESQAKARAYGREIVRLRELMRGLEPAATAVMAEHDEETTGSSALDTLINVAMELATDVRPPRGMVAPTDGIVYCPVCTRCGPIDIKAGDPINFCAQCSLGEGRVVRLKFSDVRPTLTRDDIEEALEKGRKDAEAVRKAMNRGGYRP